MSNANDGHTGIDPDLLPSGSGDGSDSETDTASGGAPQAPDEDKTGSDQS